jgi:D-alanine-D-alanine ligase
MRIGLTYDLRSDYLAAGYGVEETAEFDRADTIDCIARAIEANGHTTDRIGSARALIERLAHGDRWDLVFNIAEGMHGLGREAQVPAILDVHAIPYTFADPLVAAVALHKGWTKTLVRAAGVPTPDFAVVATVPDAKRVTLPLPLLVKPVAEGTGKGVNPASVVRDRARLVPLCAELIERYKQPALVEGFLPGREFTVGLLGSAEHAEALGTLEIVLLAQAEADVYSYTNKEDCERLVEYRHVTANDPVVARAEAIALDAWRALDCRDAGRVDLRCDARGQPQFIEVNPLAGLHPHHSDLPMIATAVGMRYEQLIGRILESAAQRAKPRAVERTK